MKPIGTRGGGALFGGVGGKKLRGEFLGKKSKRELGSKIKARRTRPESGGRKAEGGRDWGRESANRVSGARREGFFLGEAVGGEETKGNKFWATPK